MNASNSNTLIIAEAGVNHNGNLEAACSLIDVAAEAGADIVKFQTFDAGRIATTNASKANYQEVATGCDESQLEMLKRLQLDEAAHRVLIAHCESRKIRFLSTAFDIESADFLLSLEQSLFKIPSGEITNLPYLRHIGRLSRRVIMSTGMASLVEVAEAISVLEDSGTPRGRITLLHCTTQYPTPMRDVNLRAMLTLKKEFGTQVGYSDHTQGIEVAVAAVALGAAVVEKHFTLDCNLSGPDHRASLEPKQLGEMVAAIRNIEISLGDGVKQATLSESENMEVARKSIVARQNIRCGELFNAANLTTKRPGSGLSPMRWDEVIGTRAVRDFLVDEMIEL